MEFQSELAVAAHVRHLQNISVTGQQGRDIDSACLVLNRILGRGMSVYRP